MAPGEAHRSFRSALNTVAEALTAHGFAAHAEARGSSLKIIAEHCPFGNAANEHPIMCAVDRGMVRGLLGGLYGETVPVTVSSRAAVARPASRRCPTSGVRRAYLDHASTSPPRPEAVAAFTAALATTGDPGRVHSEGRAARVALEEAREHVAALVGARPREVVFTSGATEAINAVCFGVGGAVGGAFVASAVEHSAVREASARHANTIGLAIDKFGRYDADSLLDALDRAGPDAVGLVHCQWGNHEVGTLQPVAEIVELCRERGVLVHVDAASAVGQVPVDFGALGADLLSFSGHKFGAPAGTGALLVRRGLRLDPFLVGGEQERARRGGLENVPALVALGAVAAALTPDVIARGARRRARHTERLLTAAVAVDSVVAYGDPDQRLPHIVCVGVEGVEAEAVLLGLDQAGVAAHSGSACSSETLEPSPVLEAMGVEAERSLRLSTGWSTTDDDVTRFVEAFPGVVDRLRALGAAG